MSLRFHEIAEGNHRILNPFTEEKLMLLGEICRLQPGQRQLDLACGKAEMLCRWAERWRIFGTGIDFSAVFVAAARERAAELNVHHRVTVIEGDAAAYAANEARNQEPFDVVSCIGASFISPDNLVGALKLMKPLVRSGGLLLVGEPYWNAPVPDEAYAALDMGRDDYTTLVGTLDRFEAAGLELVEMVLADGDSWDRYAASQWFTLDEWLRANPDDPDATEIRAWNAREKRAHLMYQRQYLGWGVFVLRMP